MRILILSYFFPPYNTIGAVRVGKLAKYWQQRGHEVRVISAENQLAPSTLPLEIPAHQVAYTPWLDVNFFVRWFPAAASQVSLSQSGQRRSLLGKAAHLYRTLTNFPDAKIGWYLPALQQARKMLQQWQPDFIYASGFPFTGLVVARQLSEQYHIPWFAELRDLWTDHQLLQYPDVRRSLETRLERWTLNHARGLVTVSEPLAQTLGQKFHQPIATILNGYDPSDFPAVQNKQPSTKPLSLVYTGNLYAAKQDPRLLFQALRQTGLKAGDIRVNFYGHNLESVAPMIAQYDLQNIVNVNPVIPYAESLRQQREADILLLFLWNDTHESGILTGKLFEYIGASRPILAIGQTDDSAAQLIQTRGLGFLGRTPQAIADWLKSKLQQKRLQGIPDLEPSAKLGLSRDAQFEQLEQFILTNLERHG